MTHRHYSAGLLLILSSVGCTSEVTDPGAESNGMSSGDGVNGAPSNSGSDANTALPPGGTDPSAGDSNSEWGTSDPNNSDTNDWPTVSTGGSTSDWPDPGNGSDTPGNGGTSNNGADPCSAPGLTWRSARKTHYTSYPDPGSEECLYYNGCTWAGYFAGCNGQQPESWVQQTNLAAFFSTNFSYSSFEHHEICIRSGGKTMVVEIYDTCADSDCSGCCSQNQGGNDALIDLESYTNARWGPPDGVIEWADLGAMQYPGCQ